MDWIETVIIAIVEGLTEFLPVSSTGHMIIAQNLLGVPQGDPFVHAFTFIIQFGAILSVVCLYWKQFFQFDNTPAPEGSSLFQRLKHKFYFYWLLIVGVIPAVVIGLLAKKSGLLDWLLDSVEVVAVMLVLGGVFMLYCDDSRCVALDGYHRGWYDTGTDPQACCQVLVLPGCADDGRCHAARLARPDERRYGLGHQP